ncbi:MAG: hypothetical protein PHQ75_03850 [Thermoguttaceae bacterium]|nr:hypothetical protein [Thermoguttaceae bacterium]
MKNVQKKEEKVDPFFALLFSAANLMNRGETENGRKEDNIMSSLNYRQKMVLLMIGQKTRSQPEGISLNSIARALDIPLPSASLLIEALVKRDLCCRVLNPTDRRKVNITLSDFGDTIIKNLKQKTEKGYREMLDGIPTEEITIFEKVATAVYFKLFPN